MAVPSCVMGVEPPTQTFLKTTQAGASLRENVSWFKWPSGGDGVLIPKGSFKTSETRIRPWLSAGGEKFGMNLAVETRIAFFSSRAQALGRTSGGGTLLGAAGSIERMDLAWEHTDKPDKFIRTRVERMDLTWTLGRADFDLGRQPVSLGTSHFVGVLDVLAPFAPGDLDSTYKPGIDAVRVRTGLGDTGEAEVIAAANNPWRDGAAIGRLRYAVKGMDFEAVSGRLRQRTFGGIGWEGDAGKFAVWGEAALFERKKGREPVRGALDDAAFSGVAGVERFIASGLRAGCAFFYQDFGAHDPDELLAVSSEAPYQEGLAFLASAAYALATLSYEFHPLVSGNLSGLINLVDSSTLWQPVIRASLADNADLSVYGWIGTGPGPRTGPAGVSTLSEFGMTPSGAGTHFRWFF